MKIIKNAKITSTMLGYEDNGILTFWLNLDFADSGQDFGGYALGKEYTNKVLRGILKTVGVENWEDLKGQHIRVEKDDEFSKILKIGHYLEDKWFDPTA